MKLSNALPVRRTAAAALLSVVAGIQLSHGASPSLNAQRDGTNVVLNFTGRLQSSSHIEGPYTNVAGARSPHLAPASEASSQFWRSVLNDVRAIAAGGAHSAALRDDGTLWTWGANSVGQLGVGTNLGTNRPVQVGTDTNWVSVVAGLSHTMALRVDGTLWAWGENTSGQLGIGTKDNASTPVQVGMNSDWHSIAAGAAHTLAIRADGTLWAWGDNRYGQLGIGTTNDAAHPIQVGVDANWRAVAAGGALSPDLPRVLISSHSLALRNDGSLWAWGNNQSGQLGTETYSSAIQPVQVGASVSWQAVAGGELHTVALDADGRPWAWGDNSKGQLGILEDSSGWISKTNRPGRAVSTGRWQAISAGGKHTMALRVDGTLWACGDPESGRLGVGTTICENCGSSVYFGRIVPMNGNRKLSQVGTNANWRAVAAGAAHTLALRADGALWAWGEDGSGQLGTIDTNQYSYDAPFIQLGTDSNWNSVAAGGAHAVALRNDGTLWSWGWNLLGQLGVGTFCDMNEPTQIGTNSNWRMVAAGNDHTAAIRTDGTLWAWGCNSYGQLGNGTERTTNVPVQVGTDSNWSLVSAGGYYYGQAHTAAIRDDGTLWAWGYNDAGQLGSGSYTNTAKPVQVGIDNNWRSVSAGVRHTAAIRTDGTLWTWGGGAAGALGIGEGAYFTTNRPVQVGADTTWKTAAAGELITVALRTDGTLWAWGLYFVGTNRPVQVGSDANWQALSVRASRALALRSDGTIWSLSQEGPIQGGTSANWHGVSAGQECVVGFSFTVALRNDGTLWTWERYFPPARPGRPVPWLPYPVEGIDWWVPGKN